MTRQSAIIKFVALGLGIICLIQGYVIYDKLYRENPTEQVSQWSGSDIDQFSSSLQERFKNRQSNDSNLFDRFFNRDFFSSQPDPFAEMDKLHEHMQSLMDNGFRSSFDNSWDNWFRQRFSFNDKNNGGVYYEQEEGDKAYQITFHIPNLENNQLNVEVKENHITINGQFSQVREQKDDFGNVISRRQSHQSISKMIPTPYDADYEKAEIDHQKDKIVITLPKR